MITFSQKRNKFKITILILSNYFYNKEIDLAPITPTTVLIFSQDGLVEHLNWCKVVPPSSKSRLRLRAHITLMHGSACDGIIRDLIRGPRIDVCCVYYSGMHAV